MDVVAAVGREPAVLAGLAPVDRGRDGVIVAGATPAAKARELYDAHLRARLAKL